MKKILLYLLVLILLAIAVQSAWYPGYTNRMQINCSSITDGEPLLINGSTGFSISGEPNQLAWTSCSGETYVFYNNFADWIVANSSTRLPVEVEVGNISSYLPEQVWNSKYLMVQHMTDFSTTVINDSTSTGADGTKKGANEPAEEATNIYRAQDFDGVDDYITTPTINHGIGSGDFAYMVWVDMTAYTGAVTGSTLMANDNYAPLFYVLASHNLAFYSGGANDFGCAVESGYKQVIVRRIGTTISGYVNGNKCPTSFSIATSYADACQVIGRSGCTYDGDYNNADIGEVRLFNGTLSDDLLNDTYFNYVGTAGYGDLKERQTGGPGATTDINFTITDQWNGSNINTFNVDISWNNGSTTKHTTSNGSVFLSDVSDGTINVTYYNMTTYFNNTLLNEAITINISNTVTTTTFQAYICFNAIQKVNEALITVDSFTIDTTTQDCYNISSGVYDVIALKSGWYPRNQSFTITPLQNATLTVTNFSYANLTIYAVDATTNESLSGYNININSLSNPTFTESASGVTNHSAYLINDTYNVTITMPGYATTTGMENVTVSGHTNHTFSLYRSNSVTILILDEVTNNIITDNVTIRWTNNETTWENITSAGGFFISNLTPSNYTLLFYGSNYSTRTYTITVGNLSTQFLTAYMISSTYSTIFTIKDQDTGDIMSDVGFTMYKLVNSTWTTVESKYSDITGKVQVYYDPIGNYRFYLSKTSYEDLIFYLNPVLFSTYDVFMVKSSLLNYSVDYDDIAIIYGPQTFSNNENTTFNFLISSPDGLLTSYGIKLTYPGGSSIASGVNAIGEQLSAPINISSATIWDKVKLEYNYTTTLSGTRTFVQYLSIDTNATASENTWTANKDRTFGLGLFERILIVTIIVIFAVGISTMVGQPVPGMAIGLFLFGFMVYISFIPIWSILPSMFIGVLFLVWKSGGY